MDGWWLQIRGGTVGSDEKIEVAKANGCEHVINYSKENFAEKVLEITDGKGVPVVYDGVGKDTLDRSIECLAIRGMMVSFGNASGPLSGIIQALNWVADNAELPAVVNISLGGPRSRVYDEALARLKRKGIHVVVAAGVPS